MISVVIPSRNERFLQNTINDLREKAKTDIEIIAICDGSPQDVTGAKTITFGTPKGMRVGINKAVALSKGEYILKTDGHCMFDEGWDEKLLADIHDDWVVIPRRKRLDAENWCERDVGKPDIDYMLLTVPENKNDFGGASIHGKEWKEKNRDESLRDEKIVDLMSFQGSCWFMKKSYFHYLDLMDAEGWGTFWQEAQEIGLKCWLSGGRVVRNKNTWYAHLHKGSKYGRGYYLDKRVMKRAVHNTRKWFTNDAKWDKQIKPFSWMIEHFMPVPLWTEEHIKELKKHDHKITNRTC